MRATVITAACLILLASASAQQRKQTNPATPSGKPVLEAYVSAWNRHDFAALDTLLAPDAIHEDVAQGVHAQAIAQIKDFMQEEIKGEPDLAWRLTMVVDAGPMVAAEWTWNGTFTGDGPTGPVKATRISGRGSASSSPRRAGSSALPITTTLRAFSPRYRLVQPLMEKWIAHHRRWQSGPAMRKHCSKSITHGVRRNRSQDAATLNRILDDSFLYVGSSGKVSGKSDFVDEIRSIKIPSYSITGEIARCYGQTGIVTGEWRGRWSADGKEGEDRLRFTAVYTRRDGNWYAVAEQMTGLPAQ